MTTPSDDPMHLDRKRVRRNFARASGNEDRTAQLQTDVREELLERTRWLFKGRDSNVRRILDLGSGTGAALPALRQTWPDAELLALDFAAPMLTVAQRHFSNGGSGLLARIRRTWHAPPMSTAICADAAALPLVQQSVDLVFSNLMLQWCDDLDMVLAEIRRVLRPEGLVIFSTFGPDTLRELRSAWAQVDDAVHVSGFLDMHDIGDALMRAGFREPVLDVDRLQSQHTDARALMQQLKSVGAVNAAWGRTATLTGRRKFQAACAAYPRIADSSQIAATWEVVFASAFAAQQSAGMPHEFAVDVGRLRESLDRRRPGAAR